MLSRLSCCLPVLLALAVLLVCLAEPAMACPTCKESVEGAGSNLAQGYFWSILFMLSMPPLIFGGLSLYFYLLVRAARAKAKAEGATHGPLPGQMIPAK